jgi:hypothetical protein
MLHQLDHSPEIRLFGFKDHDTRVETVWPAAIGTGREAIREGEELGERAEGQDVGIEVDDLAVFAF